MRPINVSEDGWGLGNSASLAWQVEFQLCTHCGTELTQQFISRWHGEMTRRSATGVWNRWRFKRVISRVDCMLKSGAHGVLHFSFKFGGNLNDTKFYKVFKAKRTCKPCCTVNVANQTCARNIELMYIASLFRACTPFRVIDPSLRFTDDDWASRKRKRT